MIDEPQAQKIMQKFLEKKWNIKLRPRVSGPDFLHKGDAVEVKGSNFKVVGNIKQLAKYAQEYREFGLAFPTDAVNIENLVQLHIFGSIFYKAFSKFLRIHFITEKEEGRFGVLEFYDASDILPKVINRIKEFGDWKESDSTKLRENITFTLKKSDEILAHASKLIVQENSSTEWLIL